MGSRTIRGPLVYGRTTVKASAGNFTFVDEAVLILNKTVAAATTVTLPASPLTGRVVKVKDGKGDAVTNNITIQPAAGTIDGAATLVINANYGTAKLIYNGTEWNVLNLAPPSSTQQIVAATLDSAATGTVTVGGINSTLTQLGRSGQVTGMPGVNVEAGTVQGAAGTLTRIVKRLTAMADATDVALFTITIPNVLAGGSVKVTLTGTLGDGDSTDSKIYMIGVSRVAAAVAKAVASSAAAVGATAGATANATVIITVPAVTGGAAATNTFAVTARVTRSAGAATNHIVTAQIECLNQNAGGITVA